MNEEHPSKEWNPKRLGEICPGFGSYREAGKLIESLAYQEELCPWTLMSCLAKIQQAAEYERVQFEEGSHPSQISDTSE